MTEYDKNDNPFLGKPSKKEKEKSMEFSIPVQTTASQAKIWGGKGEFKKKILQILYL